MIICNPSSTLSPIDLDPESCYETSLKEEDTLNVVLSVSFGPKLLRLGYSMDPTYIQSNSAGNYSSMDAGVLI